MYFLEPVGSWESSMIEPLEARLMLSSAPLPAMDQDIPFVRDAGGGRVVVAAALADLKGVMVLRLAADGSLDPTFGHGGVVRLDGPTIVDGVIVQPDGKVLLLADDLGVQTTLRRFNTDGSLDRSFGTRGIVTLPEGELGPIALEDGSMTLMPDGRIVTAQPLHGPGYNAEEQPRLAVTRYTAAGTPDPTFGVGGTVISDAIDSPLKYSVVASVQVAADGAVAVAVWPLGEPGGLFARYRPDGTPDESWGTHGVAALDLGGAFYSWNTLPDGRILAQLRTDWDVRGLALRQFLPDGNPDPAFGDNGVNAAGPSGGSVMFDGSLVTSGGRAIVAVGSGGFDRSLIALNPDGSLDSGFGFGGSVVIENDPDVSLIITSLDATADGGIVEAHAALGPQDPDIWNVPDQLVVHRFNADGSPVSTFGTNGRVVLDFAPVGEDQEPTPDPQPDPGDDTVTVDKGDGLVETIAPAPEDGDATAGQGFPAAPGLSEQLARLFANHDAAANLLFSNGRPDHGLLGSLADDVFAL